MRCHDLTRIGHAAYKPICLVKMNTLVQFSSLQAGCWIYVIDVTWLESNSVESFVNCWLVIGLVLELSQGACSLHFENRTEYLKETVHRKIRIF